MLTTDTGRPGVNFRAVRAGNLVDDRMFRCGEVPAFTAREAALLHDHHGVRAVVDLRTPREIDKYGPPATLVDTGVRWVNAPLTGYPSTPIDKPRPTSADVVAYYHGMLEHSLPECWPRLFSALASVAHEPFLVCCHAGKDRTGVVVASVLDLLGSPTQDIAADYGASAPELVAHVDRFRDKWLKRGHTRDDYLVRMRVVPETMESWLAQVRTRHGGLARQLPDRGAHPEDLRRLRDHLTTTGSTRPGDGAEPGRRPAARPCPVDVS